MSEVHQSRADSSASGRADAASRDPVIARWLESLYRMKVEAESQSRLHTFADVLAYALAKTAFARGGEAVGYAVEMVGRQVAGLYAAERAQAEAARARENGDSPH